MKMLKAEKLDIELQLKDPIIRAIIQTYANAETESLEEAVYKPLEKKYPSSKGFLDYVKKGNSDPVARFEEIKRIGREIKNDSLVNRIEEDENEKAKPILDKMKEIITELDKKYIPTMGQFYVDLANAVKKVSADRGIGIEETVRNPAYMDEVLRIVSPTRKKAERFLATTQLYERDMFEVLNMLRNYFAYVKKIGQLNEKAKSTAGSIPTAKAAEAFLRAQWNYEMQKFDRIYSSKK